MAVTEANITLCGHGSGTPSTKNMRTYLTQRYATKASNGVRKGIVAVMRLKSMTDANRKKFHDTYKTILSRNVYSQTKRQYVYEKATDGKYYSDCSSSGMATLQKIGFKSITLLNTAGIYQSNLFEEVPVKIADGHIINPEILKVGDCILFAGDDSSRPKQIGHVEYVYEINGKTTTTVPKVPTVCPIKSSNYKLHPVATKRIRRCLNYLGYTATNGDRLSLKVAWGAKYKQAMKAFKKANGITPVTANYTKKVKEAFDKLVK